MEQMPLSSSAHDSRNGYQCVEPQNQKKFNPIDSEKEMDFFLFNGNKVRYIKKGSGPPLIFLHNAGNDHRIWDFQVEYFSKSYEVYAIDNLGYGQSDRPDIDYTLQLYSKMVSAMIEETGLTDVVIAGQCIGAAMALHYALKKPDKIKALILFNIATINGLKNGCLGFLYKLTRFRMIRRICLPVVKRLVITRWRAIQDINHQYGDIGENDNEFTEYLIRLYKHPKQLQILASLLFNFESFKTLDTFKKPDYFPPICLIWGIQNAILPMKTGKAFCKRLTPDKTYFVKNCGHLLMRENPKKINTLIDSFIHNSPRTLNKNVSI